MYKEPQLEQEERVCKICFDYETTKNQVINPCRCRGSSKFIHESCLRLWILCKYPEVINPRCEICRYSYRIVMDPSDCLQFIKKCKEYPKYATIFFLLLGILGVSIFILTYLTNHRSAISSSAGYVIIVIFLTILLIFAFACTIDILKRIYLAKSFAFKIYPCLTDSNTTLLTLT